MVNFTCNSTLEDMRITSEVPIAGNLNFHQLGLIIAGACAVFAIVLSFWTMFMHAINYTKPYEQRHIIRILLMIPIYSIAAFFSFWFYWHAIYYDVISNCYEAFAIASFFALLCHYTAPNLHDQKEFFRNMQPIVPWVLPISWLKKCCGGERGIWRTPRSGLTWFNIIWAGIYQYCFIRVTMTITAVVTEYFDKYCESSNEPWFAHIWVLVIEGVAVSIAMYMVIQFYIQLRHDLSSHSPFLKVLAIKLVIFLSFWQSFLISILTSSTFNVIRTSDSLAYPDISVGIPSLLLCVEMAIFSILHIFAYPYKEYKYGPGPSSKYPSSIDGDPNYPGGGNGVGPKLGGPFGIKAFADALNPWDLVKAFGRGMRWMFVGVRHREEDISYKRTANDMALEPTATTDTSYKGPDGLPIADEFRRSKFGFPAVPGGGEYGEGAGLIAHAQPDPRDRDHSPAYRNGSTSTAGSGAGLYKPARDRYDPITGQEVSIGGGRYDGSLAGAANPNAANVPYPNPYNPYSYETSNTAAPSNPYSNVHPALRPEGAGIGMASSGLDDEQQQHITSNPAWNPVQEVPGRVNVARPQVVGVAGGDQQSAAATHRMLWGGQQGQQGLGQQGQLPRGRVNDPTQGPIQSLHADFEGER